MTEMGLTLDELNSKLDAHSDILLEIKNSFGPMIRIDEPEMPKEPEEVEVRQITRQRRD